MAQVALPLAIGTSAASSLGSFAMQRAAASIQRGEAEIAAQAEETAAVQREADRKAALSSALATQIAGAGASGISAFEGSPLTLIEESIASEEQATQRDVFETKLQALTARSLGRIRERQIKTGANIGLLQDVGRTASMFVPSPTGGAG